jgi:parallel beta-helix repeat protein
MEKRKISKEIRRRIGKGTAVFVAVLFFFTAMAPMANAWPHYVHDKIAEYASDNVGVDKIDVDVTHKDAPTQIVYGKDWPWPFDFLDEVYRYNEPWDNKYGDDIYWKRNWYDNPNVTAKTILSTDAHVPDYIEPWWAILKSLKLFGYEDERDEYTLEWQASQQYRHSYFVLTGDGGAPSRCHEYYYKAMEEFSKGEPDVGFFYLALASHYLQDVGQPLHTVYLECILRYIEYDSYVYYNWDWEGSLDFYLDALYAPVKDISNWGPKEAVKKLAHFSRSRVHQLHWWMGSPWDPCDTWEEPTRECVQETAAYTAGLYKYAFDNMADFEVTNVELSSDAITATIKNNGGKNYSGNNGYFKVRVRFYDDVNSSGGDVLSSSDLPNAESYIPNKDRPPLNSSRSGDEMPTISKIGIEEAREEALRGSNPFIDQINSMKSNPPKSSMKLPSESSTGGDQIGEDRIVTIGAGESKEVSISWTEPTNHKVRVVVDPEGEIFESNETNNEKFEKLPDLAISPSDINIGGTIGDIIVSATVHNIGEDDASNILVKFYNGGTGHYLGSDQISFISSGGTGTASISIGDAVPIKVKVDPSDEIAESSEGNNEARKDSWEITGTVTWDSDKNIGMDLIIKSSGKLTLHNMVLTMKCDYPDQYTILVEEGGELCVDHATIKAMDSNKEYKFIICGKSVIKESTISDIYLPYGIRIYSNDVEISNSTLSSIGEDTPVWSDGDERIYPLISCISSSPKIVDNTMTTSINGMGIFCLSSTPIISRNEIATNNGTSIYSYLSKPIITDNHITCHASMYSDFAIKSFYSSSFIGNNTILVNGPDETYEGYYDGDIYLYDSSPIILDNSISGYNWYKILSKYSHIIVRNNTISSTTSYGISCDSSDGTITDSNISSPNGLAIYGESDVEIDNDEIYDCAYGVIVEETSPLISNSIITANSWNLWLDNDGDPILLNMTFDESKVHFEDHESSLSVEWYMHVKIISYDNNSIQTAYIEVYDKNGALICSGFVFGGYVRNIVCKEYERTMDGYSYYTPHNVYAWSDDLFGNETVTMDHTQEVVITLYPPPDLTPRNIAFSQANPTIITAIIYNDADVSVSNVTVGFYDGDNQIKKTKISYIPARESKEASIQWNASPGPHTVKVIVDPDNEIDESNETNNEMTSDIWIVSSIESYNDQNFVLKGDLIILNGGKLTFNNVTLKMKYPFVKGCMINVTDGGEFYVYDSNITAYNTSLPYEFEVYGKMIIENSKISHMSGATRISAYGGGIEIYSDDVRISNSTISHSIGAIIYCEGASPIIEGNLISDSENGEGIYCYGGSPMIKNNIIESNYWSGITCVNSSLSIIQNDIFDNEYGIYLSYLSNSSNTTVMNCNISDNEYGILLNSLNTIILNCNILDNRFGIYINPSLNSDNGNNISNCNVCNNILDGIVIDGSSNNNISNCNCYNNCHGIYLDYGSSDNQIMNCSFYNNYEGIGTWYSSNNQITNCDIYNNYYGTWLHDSLNNTVSTCRVYNNEGNGIIIYNSSNNQITNCDIYNNTGGQGIFLYCGSSNNRITNCTVHHNIYSGDYPWGVGIRSEGSSNNNISNCNCYDNRDGIRLHNCSNNKISNCSCYNNSNGIRLHNCSNNKISNCSCYNNSNGIRLHNCSNNILHNNVLLNNAINFGIEGRNTLDFYHDIDTFNTINGKPIYYIVGQSDLVFDDSIDIGYLGLVDCTNIIVENLTLADNKPGLLLVNTSYSIITNFSCYNNLDGIYLWNSSNNKITNCDAYNNSNYKGILLCYGSSSNQITNCTAHDNIWGIYIKDSLANKIANCSCYDNSWGILLEDSLNNQVANCDVYNNSDGIYLGNLGNHSGNSSNNKIANCSLYNNHYGIRLKDSSSNNTLSGNTIRDSDIFGIYIEGDSNYNFLYHNNFIDNDRNAHDGCNNTWNDGYPSGGNYWDDYTGSDNYHGVNQDKEGSDAIGDVPYNILGGDNQDRYPLMVPWQQFPSWITQVTTSEDDDYQPSIAIDSSGNLLIAYTTEESVMNTDVLLAYSRNMGAAWKDAPTPWEWMEGPQYSPDICYDPSAGVIIGDFVDESGPWVMYFKVPDASDPATYEYNGWKNDGIDAITDTAVTYTTLENGTELLITLLTGDTYGFNGTCMWAYCTIEPLAVGKYYYYDAQSVIGNYTDAGNLSAATFLGNHYGFVFDALVEETGRRGVAIKWTTYEEQPDLEYVENQFWIENSIDYDAIDPDIAASGNSIYAVYTSNENGDFDIKCYYSHDAGETWETSMVASMPGIDEKNPAVYASGSTVFCAYTKEGDCYFVKSTDGGATWEEPLKINEVDGTVVDEPDAVDLTSAGIVWTDNRNGNKDIYYYSHASIITTLKENWNLFSLPFNHSITLDQLFFIYSGTKRSWEEAVNGGIVYGVIYDWNRTEQRYDYYYDPTDSIDPGYGYWIICHKECELGCYGSFRISESYITTLKKNWDLFGLPFNQSITLGQLHIFYEGVEYSWKEAVSPENHIVYGVIYDWNRTEQRYDYRYETTDRLNPGYGFWIFGYKECEILYNSEAMMGEIDWIPDNPPSPPEPSGP